MLIFENYGKCNSNHQSKCSKDIPHGRPRIGRIADGVANAFNFLVMRESVHDSLGTQGADGGTEAVGHHHENALCAGTDVFIGFFFNKERTADIEEVESNAVNDAGKDEQPNATASVA